MCGPRRRVLRLRRPRESAPPAHPGARRRPTSTTTMRYAAPALRVADHLAAAHGRATLPSTSRSSTTAATTSRRRRRGLGSPGARAGPHGPVLPLRPRDARACCRPSSHPNELLDGALVGANYKTGSKTPTYVHTRHPSLLALHARHGRDAPRRRGDRGAWPPRERAHQAALGPLRGEARDGAARRRRALHVRGDRQHPHRLHAHRAGARACRDPDGVRRPRVRRAAAATTRRSSTSSPRRSRSPAAAASIAG